MSVSIRGGSRNLPEEVAKNRKSIERFGERRTSMTREIRRRISREATPEEKERHQAIRAEIEQELPEPKQWARETAARHRDRVAVGTVLTDQETGVIEAIDD